MLYFDTSFLIPLVRSEPNSAAISSFFRQARFDDLAVSHWTIVEFFSVMARDVRTGALLPDAAARANAQFETMIAESFLVILPNAADFEVAAGHLKTFKTALRAGDALHLAIAANRGAAAIYTLDKGLILAGKTLGLPVRSGIRAR